MVPAPAPKVLRNTAAIRIPMSSSFRHPAVIALAALSWVAITGCAAPPVDPRVEAAIGDAVGLEVEALVFRNEGGPDDEPTRASDRLTAADALRAAVTTSPVLQAALARVRIAMADADQARLLSNPVLSLVLRFGSGKPQVEASLTQQLLAAFQTPRRASAADNRLRQAAADAITVALNVVAEAQQRYTTTQALDALIPSLEGRLELLRKLVEVASNRLDAGFGTRADVTTLDAQRLELEVEIAAVRLSQREERLRLARLIGEPSGAASWTLDPWVPPAALADPESRWLETALQRRPEVQAVAWQLAALGDDYALTRLFPWQNAALGLDAQRDGDWFLGPSASTPLPLFDSGQAQRARLTAAQIEARHELTTARRQVIEEVRVAYASLAASLENLRRVTQELVPIQQQRRQQAEDLYRARETDVTALFLAEQNLQAAQARAIDIERQAILSMVRLQRAVGGPGVAAELQRTP